ncbi:MAG: DEAD/DEAH box helicase [Eubacteriales bacterium]
MKTGDIISDFCSALDDEVAYLMNEGGRPVPAADGSLVYRGNEGYLYIFDLETDFYLADGAPVRVRSGSREAKGEVVATEGCEITIMLTESIGDLVHRAEIYCEPWFLLTALQERLREASTRNLDLAHKVLRPASMRTAIFVRPKAALTGQEDAVRMAAEREITFLWGPPGTGKTETLARMVRAFCATGRRILVVSHCNVAVDGAMLRAAAHLGGAAAAGRIVRYGFARLPDLRQSDLLAVNLAAARHPQLRDRQRELLADRRSLLAGLRSGGKAGNRLREIERTLREVRVILKEAEATIAREAQVLGCTLAKAAVDPVVYEGDYDVVLLDEASMAYIPQVFFASSLAREKLVLSGDFRQLAPVALAETGAVSRWLKRDIFTHTGITATADGGKEPDIAVLRVQRRMHPAIAGFVNDTVYGGILYNAAETAGLGSIAGAAPFPGTVIGLIDVSQWPAYCYRHDQSRLNPLTALVSTTLAYQAVKSGLSAGLLTPYAAQARLLSALTAGMQAPPGVRPDAGRVIAATVHRFQGAEKDMVVLDLVDAFRQRSPGRILADRTGEAALRLVNVAVTRARGKLLVLAHREFLESRLPGDAILLKLFRFIEQHGRIIKGGDLLKEMPAQIQGEFFSITWHGARWPSLDSWRKDAGSAAEIQLDWPSAAGPPDREALAELQKRLARGSRLSIRAGRPEDFPGVLRRHTTRHASAWAPCTVFDRNTLWYGCPWPEFFSPGQQPSHPG